MRVPAGEVWKSNLALTRKLGDTWLKSQRSALARAPSAILPNTFNYLLNPLHKNAHRIRIGHSQPAPSTPDSSKTKSEKAEALSPLSSIQIN
jgi:hypothetical protein